MQDIDKLIKAKLYTDKLANGIDPISNRQMPQDSVLNQVELVRFFFFLSGFLQETVQINTQVATSKSKKIPFVLTQNQISRVELSDKPIPITELTQRINTVVDPSCKKFSYKWTIAWLLDARFLEIDETINRRVPTLAGEELGIFQEVRFGQKGQYWVTLYSKEAQQFILDNMDAILKSQGYFVIP